MLADDRVLTPFKDEEMQVRSARLADIDQVVELVARIVDFHRQLDVARFGALDGAAEMYRGWLADRCDDETSVFLVADRNEEDAEEPHVVGFLIATLDKNVPIYRVERFGFIHDLWVEPDYRHEGVGRSLATLALERFQAIGATQVRLDTAASNDSARALFSRCGFRPSAVEMICEL